LLKGGIVYADFLTTVSPTYSLEIQTSEYGCGLEGVLSQRNADLCGIINGIDTEVWNPKTDPFLENHYESMYVEHFRTLSEKYSGRVAFRDAFNEGLAHRIEAGADVLLMPSLYEPCGLSQLYSLRYGTVPLVRKTGGLADTVIPCTPRNLKEKRATGFMFTESTPDALLPVLMLATAMYDKKSLWRRIMTSGMRIDNSWNRSAMAYLNLFRQIVAGVSSCQ
jgi:glycogen synthase